MGFFNRFKNIIRKKEIPKEIPKQIIEFEDISNLISSRKIELKNKEKSAFELINEKINSFNQEIKEKIEILKQVDITPKKANDRIKSVVIESRDSYIPFVERFIMKINELKKDKIPEFISETDKLFQNFHKATFKNYERATILIGKEMSEIKNSFKELSNFLLSILDENKNMIELSEEISKIEKILNKIQVIGNEKIHLNKEISDVNEKINKKERENSGILENIKQTKQNKEYFENIKNKEKIIEIKEELKKEIIELRQMIDFKKLAGFFHIFENKIKIVNEYRNNFLERFPQDNGRDLLKLLEESSTNTNEISKKIKNIVDKNQELEKLLPNIKEDNIKRLEFKSENAVLEIESLNKEKTNIENKAQKLSDLKKDLIGQVKNHLEKFNVELNSP